MAARRRAHAHARVGFAFFIGAFTAVAIVVAGSTTACGTDDAVVPPPLPTSTANVHKDAGVVTGDGGGGSTVLEATVASPEASAAATTFKGTLDKSTAVPFGGNGFCDYSEVLKPITIEIAALPEGDVISATVKDTSVESVVVTTPPCPYGPASPANQTFSLATSTKSAGGTALTFVGGPSNTPETQLNIDLVKSGASYEASATWHRTDQVETLNWTVKAKISLTGQ